MNRAESCTWIEDEQSGAYDTSCGHIFEMICDTPQENDFQFCCYCGGKLVVKAADAEEEEE